MSFWSKEDRNNLKDLKLTFGSGTTVYTVDVFNKTCIDKNNQGCSVTITKSPLSQDSSERSFYVRLNDMGNSQLYRLGGTYSFKSYCNQPGHNSQLTFINSYDTKKCYYNGSAVAQGTKKQFCTSSSVAYGNSCNCSEFTCNNGSWGNNGYQYTSCVQNSPSSCPASGGCPATKHGKTCTTYNSVTCPTKSCSTVTATCNNGKWSGTIGSSSCTVKAKNNCDSSYTFTGLPNSNSSTYDSCTDYAAGTCTPTIKYRCTDGYRAIQFRGGKWECELIGGGGGGGGGGICFIAGTKVTMADGTYKNIEDVQIGDVLKGETSYNKVLQFYRPLLGNDNLVSYNNSDYFVTESHPFKTLHGRKSLQPTISMKLSHIPVSILKQGDHFITESGTEMLYNIQKKKSDPNTQLYNFTVDGDHTYYANGYLVHNKPIDRCTCSIGYYKNGNECCNNRTHECFQCALI